MSRRFHLRVLSLHAGFKIFAHFFVACMEHSSIKDGWFREGNQELWPGQAMSLEVEEILFSKKSDFQDVLVFKR